MTKTGEISFMAIWTVAMFGCGVGVGWCSGGVSVSQSTRKVNLTRSVSVGSQKQSTNAGCSGNSSAVPLVLSLLWRAESSYGSQMTGDGGLARGHFSQHEAHWAVGTKALGVDWAYPDDTHNLARAAAVCAANWAVYAKQALEDGDVEYLIRSHRKPCDVYGSGQAEYLAKVKGESNE